MDFGRATATGSPDCFFEGPPFPPAAERCALTCVASIATVPTTPVLPVSALNIASQMPCRLHLHQPGDALLADGDAFSLELGMDTRRAVGPARRSMDRACASD
jgi:hypothetical protein